ncbi:hypothetical protein QCA50_006022 [Cerrena zonata]|uniref:Uncharacterized protein n=1 Tax=Cerrena zonata TaxID=2478898 RepID=A0AAW0GIC9_9APHY
MSLREPTPTRRMSAIPKPSMVPKPYQVEEMQVKIRELEGTVDKLRIALNSEQTRSKDSVQKIHQSWTKERAEWQAGCDAIQVAHRINFLKTAVEVENQKMLVLKEKDNYRIQQIARIQRDFNLVKFQIHEVQQEERNAQLEDEVERLQEALEDARYGFQEELGSFRDRCDIVEKKLARKIDETQSLLEEKSQIEKSLALIRAEHTSLLSSSTTKGSDLERANLRYDSLKSTHTELETKFSEVQQTNADLRRQLDKWRDLEHREGDELSELRKVRIELKVQVSDLESKLEEASRKAKERKEKVKSVFQEQEDALEEASELTQRLEAENEELKDRLSKAEKLVQDLKVQAEAERSRAEAALQMAKRPSGSGSTSEQRGSTSYQAEPSQDVENEVVVSPPRPKARPATSGKGRRTASKTHPASDNEVEVQESPPKITKGKGKAKVIDLVSDDGVAPSKPKPRGKKAPPKKNSSATTNNEENGDVQDVPAPVKRKGKRKTANDDNDANGTSDEDRGKSAKSKATASAKPKSAGKPKAPSRQASSRKDEEVEEKDDDGEPEAGLPKKKKRKINLFPGAQGSTFQWSALDQGGDGLNIPIDLSPVKDHDAIPPRSTSRVGSTMSWNRR